MTTKTQLRRLRQIEAQLQQREADPTAIPELAAARGVKTVQDAIAAKYDMFVSEAYAADLIAFVDVSNEQVLSLLDRIAELEARLEPTPEDTEALLHERA